MTRSSLSADVSTDVLADVSANAATGASADDGRATSPARRATLGRLGVLAAAAASVTATRTAFGQAGFPNPSRPIKLVVPFPPGSATDVPVRAMANVLSRTLGTQVVVENKPGATATLGPVSVAQGAAPDGYTLAIAPASLWRLPHMQKVNYDPIRDFTYIAGLAGYTYGVAVMVEKPWKTLAELVAAGKANPGKLNLGGVGIGGSGHISCFRLSKATGAEFTYVPFKGGAEVSAAMQGDNVDGTTDAGWAQLVQTGRARLLTVFTEKRLAKYPDVPTARELGYDIVIESPWGVAGPKGMDPAVVKILQDAFLAAREEPDVRKQLEFWDLQLLSLDSKAYTAMAERIFAKEKKNLEDLEFKPN